MEKIKKFMYGRNGGDQLSMALVILSIILTFGGQLAKISWLPIISYIPLGLSLFRMFSKDVAKRRMENYKFAMFLSPIYSKFKNTQKRLGDTKTHKYYRCPNCNQQLRVPKGKGKVMVTCTKCKTKFEKRT